MTSQRPQLPGPCFYLSGKTTKQTEGSNPFTSSSPCRNAKREAAAETERSGRSTKKRAKRKGQLAKQENCKIFAIVAIVDMHAFSQSKKKMEKLAKANAKAIGEMNEDEVAAGITMLPCGHGHGHGQAYGQAVWIGQDWATRLIGHKRASGVYCALFKISWLFRETLYGQMSATTAEC